VFKKNLAALVSKPIAQENDQFLAGSTGKESFHLIKNTYVLLLISLMTC
jgi:hypothetical protein